MNSQPPTASAETVQEELARLVKVGVNAVTLEECNALVRVIASRLGDYENIRPDGRNFLMQRILDNVIQEHRLSAFEQHEAVKRKVTITVTSFQIAAAGELLGLTDDRLFPIVMKFRCAQLSTTWSALQNNPDNQGVMATKRLRASIWLGAASAKTGERHQPLALRALESAIKSHVVTHRDELVASSADYLEPAVSLEKEGDSKSLTSDRELVPTPVPSRLPSRKSLWLTSIGVAVCMAVVAGLIFAFGDGSEGADDEDSLRSGSPSNPSSSSSASSAEALERRYDGKDPRGLEGSNSKCADPPTSQPVSSAHPSVIGPDGKDAGSIELRTSAICPVIWARVLWNDDLATTYRIPEGWTLHIVAQRPKTKTRRDSPVQASITPIEYGLSSMLTTLRGCVFVEVYFANGDRRTPAARTPCVMHPELASPQ
ncbi:hypothetical protein QFZ75_006338 [Streptomyces sp. V3I8]|uniref:hypothetical protein n=1 Tax=Streptomyces sp. V3I8 TaxID=3042279 RepID=UPI00278B419E|nr:hypothetical protein [Streptomyces sp. V3I8]MDQ1039922.1 hypothetical protein [Streptomyces sp. V3I8]